MPTYLTSIPIIFGVKSGLPATAFVFAAIASDKPKIAFLFVPAQEARDPHAAETAAR